MARDEEYWERWREYQATGKWRKSKKKKTAHFTESVAVSQEPNSVPRFTQEPLFETEREAPTQEDFDRWINEPGISKKKRQNRQNLIGDHGPILGWDK